MGTKIKCTKCNTVIEGDKKGTFTTCECGQCYIDETPYYCRIGGDPEYILCIDEDGNEKPMINKPEPEVTENKDSKIIYIFLDVDGVLNNQEYLIECYEKNGGHSMSDDHTPFDPKCLNNLMKLVRGVESKDLEPKIILSSTWRLSDISIAIVNSRLAEYGMKVFDKTPNISAYEGKRGEEIMQYLQEHQDYKDFIVIDDDDFDIIIKAELKNKLIKTNAITGFNDEALQMAIEYFNITDKQDD